MNISSKLLAAGFIGALLVSASAHADEEMERRIGELEDRLDVVERKSVLDRLNFSGEFRTILNSFLVDRPDEKQKVTAEVWSQRLRINFRANPIESLRISGRIAMFKNFGDDDSKLQTLDFERSLVASDTTARIDHVWIDWFIQPWLALSAGRIVYAEGPPENLKNNSSLRQGTWGTYLLDGEFDSINLTATLSQKYQVRLRLFYTSFFNDDDETLPFEDAGYENNRVFGINAEFTIPQLGENFFQFGIMAVPKLTLYPRGIKNSDLVPGILNATLEAQALAAGISPSAIPQSDVDALRGFLESEFPAGGPLDPQFTFPSKLPDSLGSWYNIGGIVVFYDIAKSGLDVFLAGTLGIIEPSNRGIEYPIRPIPETNPALINLGSRISGFESSPLLYLSSYQ